MLKNFVILCLVVLVLFSCERPTDPEYPVATPTFSPSPGTYFSPLLGLQAVKITTATSNATIRYTLDGTEPTASSEIYTAPIPVNGYTIIKARGYRAKMKPSALASGIYSFEVGNVFMIPRGGTFTTPQMVTINAVSAGTVIHYTTDGTEPTATSEIYTAPLLIDRNMNLKVKGFMTGWNSSSTVSANFVFNVAHPTFSLASGTYFNAFTVTLNTPTSGAMIYYTTDGTDPTESSLLYTDPIPVNSTMQLRVRAFKENWNPSPMVTANYTLKAVAPTFSPNPNTFFEPQTVSISSTTTEAKIYYTTDGSEPSANSNQYSVPLNLSANTVLKARAIKTGWSMSNVSTGTYQFRVHTPVFNPPSGLYSGWQTVTITCATPGAEIRFTTNNTDPTVNSQLYTAPITVSVSTNVRAIGIKTGMNNSQVASAIYQITNTVATPTFSPDPGVIYAEPVEVTISCATPGASIYYTTDGSEPTTSSTLFYFPIQVDEHTEIRARAFRLGFFDSQIATAIYQVSNIVATPTFSPDPGVLYFTAQIITITCDTPGSEIRYTLDGTEPSETSELYEDPILLSTSAQVKAKGFRAGWIPSETASAQYQIETSNLFAWGLNTDGQCNVPLGAGFIQVDAGDGHTVALRANGSLAAWGVNDDQQCNFPAGNNFVAVSAGGRHSLALRTDGTVVAWGANDSGQSTVPPPVGFTYQAISAGGSHSLALTSNNKLVAWGSNSDGQSNVPPDSNFIKISAGGNHNLALRQTGELFAWGNNNDGQINAPTGNNYVDIAAGGLHSIARRTNGTLIAWGSNSNEQATVPIGADFMMISAGKRHNLALRTNGTLITWGYSAGGLGTVPTGNNYIGVSAGGDFSVVLKSIARTRIKR